MAFLAGEERGQAAGVAVAAAVAAAVGTPCALSPIFAWQSPLAWGDDPSHPHHVAVVEADGHVRGCQNASPGSCWHAHGPGWAQYEEHWHPGAVLRRDASQEWELDDGCHVA